MATDSLDQLKNVQAKIYIAIKHVHILHWMSGIRSSQEILQKKTLVHVIVL